MNLLWDLRLYSLGYSFRGVGKYTTAVIENYLKSNFEHKIYLLGDSKKIPYKILDQTDKVIYYKCNNWKEDLFKIPTIVKNYNIDTLHYWIALGPIHSLGLGLNPSCKTIATIYDISVEHWHENKFVKSKRKTWFWKIQKLLIKNVGRLNFISNDTAINFSKFITNKKTVNEIIYPPLKPNSKNYTEKSNYLIVLGGAENKNLKRTIKAFNLFNKLNMKYKLLIVGDCEEIDKSTFSSKSIEFVNFKEYYKILPKSLALLAFSTHEGLGLPPLEALSCGIPVAVSKIPSYQEILNSHAEYADPFDIQDMANAISKVVANNSTQRAKAQKGFKVYLDKCKDNNRKLKKLYYS